MQLDVHPDRFADFRRDQKQVVHDAGCTWGNLIVVEGDEDVLGVAAVDSAAFAVEHEGVDEVRPGIDLAVGGPAAAASDDEIAAGDCDVQPHLVRVGGALREEVPHLDGADDCLDQVALTGPKSRDTGPDGSGQRGVDGAATLEPEDVHPHDPLEKVPVGIVDPLGHPVEGGDGGVGGGELVVMDGEQVVEVAVRVGLKPPGPEVARRHQLHVAAVAVCFGFGRVVEAAHAVAGDAAEQEGVIVVLPAEELVGVELRGQVDLVASAAELRGPVQRLEKDLLVKIGLGLDQLLIDPPQNRVV